MRSEEVEWIIKLNGLIGAVRLKGRRERQRDAINNYELRTRLGKIINRRHTWTDAEILSGRLAEQKQHALGTKAVSRRFRVSPCVSAVN